MTRNMVYPNADELKRNLLPGYAVVAIVQEDGSLKIYDEPKKIDHPYEQRLLECNLAGARVLHKEKALLVPFIGL